MLDFLGRRLLCDDGGILESDESSADRTNSCRLLQCRMKKLIYSLPYKPTDFVSSTVCYYPFHSIIIMSLTSLMASGLRHKPVSINIQRLRTILHQQRCCGLHSSTKPSAIIAGAVDSKRKMGGIHLSRAEMNQFWEDLNWDTNKTADDTAETNLLSSGANRARTDDSNKSTVATARKEFVFSKIRLGDGEFEGKIEQSLMLSGHLDTAIDILRDWHQAWIESPTLCIQPTFAAYSRVIFRLQQMTGYAAAEQAGKVLQMLLEMIDSHGLNADNKSLKSLYQIVIQLYTPNIAIYETNNLDIGAIGVLMRSATEAERWLRSLEDRQDVVSKHMVPDRSLAYTAVLSGYARAAIAIKAARKTSKVDRDHLAYLGLTTAQGADRLLLHMETRHAYGKTIPPSLHCYKAVLTAWSTIETLEGADNAHEIMVKMDSKVGSIDSKSFSTVLHALSAVSTNDLYHPQNEQHPALKALQVLYEMEERRRNGQNIWQTVNNYNLVLSALGQARMEVDGEDFGPLAPAPLATSLTLRLEMECEKGAIEGAPDLYTNGGLLQSWCHHPNHNEAVSYIEVTVERMERLFEGDNHNVKPGAMSNWFSRAIRAIGKSSLPDAPQRCEAILDRMTHYPHYKCYEYVATILAWANPNNPNLQDRAVNAKRILRRVAKPNTKCYTAVLRACLYDDDANTALSIAEEMCHEAPPHYSVFVLIMEVYNQHLPAGTKRDEKLREVFEMACKEGCVHFYVTQKLEEGVSRSVLVDLVGESNVEKLSKRPVVWRQENFAPEWTANVVNEK